MKIASFNKQTCVTMQENEGNSLRMWNKKKKKTFQLN